MPKAFLSRAQVDSAPDAREVIVGAVYDLLARHRYDELSPAQKRAQLVLFYSNEVFNGGHLQYFHNQGLDRADELIAALDEIGAAEHRAIFEQALAYAREHPVEQAGSLEEYSDWAHEQEFRAWDDAHYALPELGNDLLAKHVVANVKEFAVLE